MNVLETLQEQYRRTRSKPTADRHKIKNRHPHAGENGYVKRLYPRKDEWIGLDGEGVNLCGSDTPCGADGINHKPGCHVYVLLASSTGEYITNERGLSSGEIFSFLCDLALAHPRGIMACYGASYDMNTFLEGLPYKKLKDLWTKGKGDLKSFIKWKHVKTGRSYSIGYKHRKSMSIRRYGVPETTIRTVQHADGTVDYEERPNWDGTCKVWDVLGFFQGRFVDVLADYFKEYTNNVTIDGKSHEIINFPDGLSVDLTRMRKMKHARGSFTSEQLERDILPYCFDEVKALVRLMQRFKKCLDDVGIDVGGRWDGAGAIATALLTQYKMKEHLHERIPTRALYKAQLSAYSGGRVELGLFGFYLGTTFNNDENSAYPTGLLELPSLTGGQWKRVKDGSRQPYSLSLVQWTFDDNQMYYPFFYRDKDDMIYYPACGAGWHYKPEIDAAQKAIAEGKLKGTLSIRESWEFYPANDVKPFAFIRERYAQRKRLKEQDNPAENAVKLGLNSLYGKTAQAIGGTEAHKPPFHNIGYAGYTTAHCRAAVFTALIDAPESTIAIATDGIYSTKALSVYAPKEKELGAWSSKTYDGMIAVQAGVFFLLKKRDGAPGLEEQEQDTEHDKFFLHQGVWYDVTPKYRGFDKGALTPGMILDAWQRYSITGCAVEGVTNVAAYVKNTKQKPSMLQSTSSRFITLGGALPSSDKAYAKALWTPDKVNMWTLWRTWHKIVRYLDVLPQAKRVYSVTMNGPLRAHERLMATSARTPLQLLTGDMVLSKPFNPRWNRDEPMNFVDGVDQDMFDLEQEERWI